jgi:hypothetical protein
VELFYGWIDMKPFKDTYNRYGEPVPFSRLLCSPISKACYALTLCPPRIDVTETNRISWHHLSQPPAFQHLPDRLIPKITICPTMDVVTRNEQLVTAV